MKKFVTALVVVSGLALASLPASASDGEYYCPPGAKFCPPPPGNGFSAAPAYPADNAPFGQMAPQPYGRTAPTPGQQVAYREPNREYFESQLNEGETLIMVSPGGGPVDGLTPGAIYMGPPADYDMGPMATNYMRQPPPPAPTHREQEVKYYPLDVYTPGQPQPHQSAPAPQYTLAQAPAPAMNYSLPPVPVQPQNYARAEAPVPAEAPGFMPPPPSYMPPPPGHQRQVALTPPVQPVPVMATPTMATGPIPMPQPQMRQQPPYHEAFADQGPARRQVYETRSDDREAVARQASTAVRQNNRKPKKAEVISEIANETAQKNRPGRDGKKVEQTDSKVPWWKGGFLRKKSRNADVSHAGNAKK
ncbi:MAG: hypothetical protein LIQ30_00755 [Planctomycetes bacterium]|nr:hypothetical protein [Planctomycetota bacterium]